MANPNPGPLLPTPQARDWKGGNVPIGRMRSGRPRKTGDASLPDVIAAIYGNQRDPVLFAAISVVEAAHELSSLAMTVACPYCGSAVSAPCVTRTGAVRQRSLGMPEYHQARLRLARDPEHYGHEVRYGARRSRADREATALALRDAGATYAAIGAQFGMTLEGARQLVLRARQRAAESAAADPASDHAPEVPDGPQ